MHIEELVSGGWGSSGVVELQVLSFIPVPIGFAERWDLGTCLYATDEICYVGISLRVQFTASISSTASIEVLHGDTARMQQWHLGIRTADDDARLAFHILLGSRSYL